MATPEHPLPATDPHNVWLSRTNTFNLNPELSRNGVRERLAGEGSQVLVDEALQFIATQAAQQKPFFVAIWFASPHREFEALPADMQPFAALDQPSARHHGELVAIDRAIGALRRGLLDLNVDDDTLVWFKSDNGGLPDIDYRPNYPGIHPDASGHLRGFKKDLYEGGLRVPAIIEWPNRISPRVSHFPASTMDVFPTLIDVAGLDPSSINTVHDGRSLNTVFTAEPERRREPIGFRAGSRRAAEPGWTMTGSW